MTKGAALYAFVAFRKEGVDRNSAIIVHFYLFNVAFRKEGVDRNILTGNTGTVGSVAFRKEGVDRNQTYRTRS